MTTEYTKNFRLNLPDFRMGPWHDLTNTNTINIDELLLGISQGAEITPWMNDTDYSAGQSVIDLLDSTSWLCRVSHTSASAPLTFTDDRLIHPNYWIHVGQIGPVLKVKSVISDNEGSNAYTVGVGPPEDLGWPSGNTGAYNYNFVTMPPGQASISLNTMFSVKTPGSGIFGTATAHSAIGSSITKDDYLVSIIDGELLTQQAIVRQGRKGDASVLLGSAAKVKSNTPDDNGSVVGIELETRWVDPSNNTLNNVHTIVGAMDPNTGVSGGLGFGFIAENWVGTNYSAFFAGNYQGIDTNVKWKYAFIATGDRTVAAQYFRIVGNSVTGPAQPGDIIQGVNGLTKTIRNLGGVFQVRNTADNATLLSITDAGLATLLGHLVLPTGPGATNAVRKDYVDTANSLKADKTYVDIQDALKADKTYVDTQDALKVAKLGDTMTGALNISNGTASSSITTGALVVAGGVGISGAANFGNAVSLTYANPALSLTGTEASAHLYSFIESAGVLYIRDGTGSGSTKLRNSDNSDYFASSNSGTVIGAPTGGAKGAGTLNASAVYDDNVLLTCMGVQHAKYGKVNLRQWDKHSPTGEHKLAHEFSSMLAKGFDPRDPKSFVKLMLKNEALPGMPNAKEWRHNEISTGEMISRLWLALELLASAFATVVTKE